MMVGMLARSGAHHLPAWLAHWDLIWSWRNPIIAGVADGEGGLDEGGVGEGLGVVAEVAVGGGVDLLGEEAERVGEVEEVVEQLGRLVDPAGAGEGLAQPERAGKEGAFGAGEAVLAGRVAVQQGAAGAELVAHGLDGGPDPERVSPCRGAA